MVKYLLKKVGDNLKIYLLHNTNNINKDKYLKYIKSYYPQFTEINILDLNDKVKFFKELDPSDLVILVGGDGTLNHFINDLVDFTPINKIYYYPGGTGNDFHEDLMEKFENGFLLLNPYIKNLPIVIINDKKYKFINGIGYGLDGYCCTEGEKIRAKNPKKKVNYTVLALKQVLYKFKRRNATVTVDGVRKEYKKVWLAPTMKGRFYGGGMMIAPNQDRDSLKCTSCVVHSFNKLQILFNFKKIFRGTHISLTKYIDIKEGKEIEVKFDKPCDLQVDGEVFKDILSYKVISNETSDSDNSTI